MDTEHLVDTVTRLILERLTAEEAGTAVPPGVLGAAADVRAGFGPSDAVGADYLLITQAAFRAFHGGVTPAGLAGTALPAPAAGSSTTSGCVDLSGKKVVTDRDVRALGITSGSTVKVSPGAIVTALARDYVNGAGAKIVR